jgi:hypothetical protein|tara:strand:- start:4159 stop:4761 length:603 start_codon:yes stop_codon:yes gene_type:complete
MSGPNFPSPDSFLSGITTMVEPDVQKLQALDTWVVDDLYYPGYKKFLKLFNESSERHVDYGNGTLYYKRNMKYPTDIDPIKEYLSFIKFQLQNLPIRIKDFQKAWGVKYPPGAYSGLHCHQPGRQLTSVLFLDTPKPSVAYPLAGCLTTLQPADSEITYLTHNPIEGKMVIMDGKVFHGSYPALEDRHVFVVDFEYESVI